MKRIALIGCAIFCFMDANAQFFATAKAPQGNGYPPIELLSRQLTSPDSAKIFKLSEEVYSMAGIDGQLAEVANSFIRLTSEAQERYYLGQADAVQEENVVTAVNYVSEQLHMPAFTRTDLREVRMLREDLRKVEPSFIGHLKLDQRSLAEPLTNNLSPLEAIHVASMMAIQKIYSPRYQMSSEERTRLILEQRNSAPRLNDTDSARRRIECLRAFDEARKEASLADLLQLSSKVYDLLGVRPNADTARIAAAKKEKPEVTP